MSFTLICPLLVALAYGSSETDKVQVFEREEIIAFADHHFNLYFNDCDQFVGLFADDFEYCDGLPCHSSKETLMDACKLTFGSKNIVHSMNFLPAAFPNPLTPSYNHVAIKGKQTVWLPDSMDINEWITNPNLKKVPVCFDHVIEEQYRRVEKTKSNEFGIVLTAWRGFYTMAPGICDGESDDSEAADL